MALQAIKQGVRGILRKNLEIAVQLDCLGRIQNGEVWLGKELTDQVSFLRSVNVTGRESQIITMVAQGLKNKEIGAKLNIAEGTVKVFLSRLYNKSQTRDRFQLAMSAIKNLSTGRVPLTEIWKEHQPKTGRILNTLVVNTPEPTLPLARRVFPRHS